MPFYLEDYTQMSERKFMNQEFFTNAFRCSSPGWQIDPGWMNKKIICFASALLQKIFMITIWEVSNALRFFEF